MLGAKNAPHEIWLSVASYLSVSEIRRLALVHHVFAALALESWAAERRTFILNTGSEYSGSRTRTFHTDWGNTAHRLGACMQRYMSVR